MKPWVHSLVGFVLISMLVIGLTLIIRSVNSDMRMPEFDSELAARGLEVAQENGCIACHTLDGTVGIGPTWLGMFGKTETLTDGSTVVVDEDYIIESIVNPEAQQVRGFQNVMVRYFLSREDLDALVAFTRQLGNGT